MNYLPIDQQLRLLKHEVCLLQKEKTTTLYRIQIKVGVNAGLAVGDTSYIIKGNVKPNSVEVYLDGVILPILLAGQISYSVAYKETSSTITFYTSDPNEGVSINQLYIIRYELYE